MKKTTEDQEQARNKQEIDERRKLKKARDTRSKGYEKVKIKEGDLVYYQHQYKKAWMGAVKVFVFKGKIGICLQILEECSVPPFFPGADS